MALNLAAVNPTAGNYDGTVDIPAVTNYETAMVTWLNNNNPGDATARGAALTAPNAYAIGDMPQIMINLLFHLAHNGTNTSVKLKNKTHPLPTKGTVTGERLNFQHFIDQMAANGITPRMYLRAYAQSVFDKAKAAGTEFRLGRKHGIDAKYGYCGFDAAIYATGLNTHERAAAHATYVVAIKAATGGPVQVSDAANFTNGVVGHQHQALMF